MTAFLIAIALAAVSGLEPARASDDGLPPWCECYHGPLDFCPSEEDREKTWEEIIEKYNECIWGHPFNEQHRQKDIFWRDWRENDLYCVLANPAIMYSNRSDGMFDWDRNDDGLRTEDDILRFLSDSQQCNGNDLLFPGNRPDFEFDRQDLIDLICIYLANDGSGQQFPDGIQVGMGALFSSFDHYLGDRPTGSEIGQVMGCYGPDLPILGPCGDWDADGKNTLDDIMVYVAGIDYQAGGNGAGSSGVDMLGEYGNALSSCSGSLSQDDPDYCNDVIGVGEDLIEGPIGPGDGQDLLDDAQCEILSEIPATPELNLPVGDGDYDPSYPTSPINGPCDENNDGGNPVSKSPVSLTHGFKVESATDLVIPVKGRDFVLTRSYNSDPGVFQGVPGPTRPGLVGANWFMNAFAYTRITGDVNLKLFLARFPFANEQLEYAKGVYEWYVSRGIVTQTYGEETIQALSGYQGPIDVWAHEEPGQWIREYFRANGDNHGNMPNGYEGLILRERDSYGNAFVYHYTNIGDELNPNPRCIAIAINGTLSAAEAIVNFRWNHSTDNAGRLDEVTVQRHTGMGMEETHRVEYRYKKSNDGLSDDVGNIGDLIEVRRFTKVNGGGYFQSFWREQITQYRYHDEYDTPCTSCDERLQVDGRDHQLKMVIEPEQIEHFAQLLNWDYSFSEARTAHGDAAAHLLTLNDNQVWYDDGAGATHMVVDLASKIMGYAYVGISDAVAVQYLQSGCACDGSTHGVKQTYSWHYWPSEFSNGLTCTLTEYKGTGYGTLHRTEYFDTAKLESNSPLYLQSWVIVESDVPGQGFGRTFARYYEYDEQRRRTTEYYPSAIAAYTPAPPDGSAAPVVDFKSDDGMIVEYAFNDDNRVTEVFTREGALGAREILQRIEYSSELGREYLPVRIDRFRVADEAAAEDDRETTWFDYGFRTGADESLAWVCASVEADRELENGPSTPTAANYAVTHPSGALVYQRYEMFDHNGLNSYSRASDHTLTYRYFDVTGQPTQIIENANLDDFPPATFANIDTSGWTNRWNNDDLITAIDCDEQGRITKITTPDGRIERRAYELAKIGERPGLYYYAEAELPHLLESGELDASAFVMWINAAGAPIGTSEYSLWPGNTYQYDTASFDLGDELARSRVEHALSGAVLAEREWADLDPDREVVYTTRYEYDDLGRIATEINANGTRMSYLYDSLDRVLEVSVGTTAANEQKVADFFYDSPDLNNPSQGTGDGLLSVIREHDADPTLGAGPRETKMRYDYRGQPTLIEEPEAPHLALEYDNLGRVVTRSQVSDPTDPLGSMLRLERFDFSQRGAPYRARFAIDPLNEGLGHLESHRWFDAAGRVIAEWEPNTPAIKAKYDAFGRVSAVYTTDRGGDAAPGEIGNHADALDLFDDRVVSQLETRFNAVGQPDLETTRERLHDTGATGPLDDASSVATYTGYFFDDASRPIRIAEYGTNAAGFESGGPVPTIDQLNPPTPGDPNDPAIVIGVSYDIRGLADEIIDPDGRVTKTFYDALAREIIVIENQVAVDSYSWDDFLGQWTFTGLSDNADRVTSSYYDGLDNITKVVAHLPDGAGGETTQATKFIYGVLNGDPANHTDSLVNSVDLLDRVEYPDGTSIHYAWNRLGELRAVLDQNQTTHSYLRDAAGRVVRDSIETERQSLVDARVRAIAVEYDALGRRAFTRSLDEFDTVLNAVGVTFSAAGQLDSLYQNPFGEVQWDAQTGDPIGDTVRVDYDYAFAPVASGSGEGDHGNRLRLSGVTYPDTTTLGVKYGPSNGLNDRIGRIASLGFDSGPGAEALDLVSYQFMGESRAAIVDYLMPEVQLDRTATREGQRRYGAWQTGAAGEYAGWDRFGRPQRLSWVDWDFTEDPLHPTVPAKPPVISRLATFDKASNILARYDDRPGARIDNRDFEFDYDDLDRLTTVRRGDSDGGASWTNGKGGQSYLLDILGNWKEHATDLTGDGDFDDVGPNGDRRELRAHNEINQLTERDFTNDPALGDPTPLPFMYDANGNLWRSEINTDVDAYEYVHDAWNRLVRIEFVDENNLHYKIAEYEYNGLHWRCVKRADTAATPDGQLDEVRIGYFDAQWRLLEELVDDAADDPYAPAPNRRVQYAWGVRGLDDIIIHREDPDLDGDYDEHYYHLTDEQFSTLAIVDDTGLLNERVSYDAYGAARHHYAADFDGDGDVDVDDSDLADLAAGAWIYEANYNADADLNRDGRITYADRDLAIAMYGSSGVAALPTGALSDPDGADNRIGYAGYVFAPESHIYLARYRHYSPELGRWLEEDPLGYVDGMSMYEGVDSNPIGMTDPSGLWSLRSLLPGARSAKKAAKEGLEDLRSDCQGYYDKYVRGEMDHCQFQRLMRWCRASSAQYLEILDSINAQLFDAFLEGLEDGAILAADNVLGLVGGDLEAADRIRDEWGHLASYRWGDRFSKAGAILLATAVEEVMFGGVCFVLRGACFPEGTLVPTETGLVPIERITTDHTVLSFDPRSSSQTNCRVTATFRSDAPILTVITLRSDSPSSETITLTGTPDHPIWLPDSARWIRIADLSFGDRILTQDNSHYTITSVVTIRSPRGQSFPVYNFSVAATACYYAFNSKVPTSSPPPFVLVHNAGRPCGKFFDLIDWPKSRSGSRSKYWKWQASKDTAGKYGPENIARMRKGKPPLHPTKNVPKELHHTIPVRDGGSNHWTNLEELWPWDHALVDPHRFYNGPRP